MPPNFDRIFDAIHAARPARGVTFQKALSYTPATSEITFAPAVAVNAKVWDKPRTFDLMRGGYVTDDRTSVVVWFRDWFGRSTDDATPTEVAQMIADAKGQVREGDPERYSRWTVDGVVMKVESHSLVQRPDGRIHAVRFWLAATS